MLTRFAISWTELLAARSEKFWLCVTYAKRGEEDKVTATTHFALHQFEMQVYLPGPGHYKLEAKIVGRKGGLLVASGPREVVVVARGELG